MDAQKIHLSRVSAPLAAQMLAGCDRLDPAGLCEPSDIHAMAEAGKCFTATGEQGQAVYIIKIKNGVAWVDACKGFGPEPWADILLPVIEAQAKGCRAVAFQTTRRALVKKATEQGYQITGYTLSKTLP